jgi:hypothetical protein
LTPAKPESFFQLPEASSMRPKQVRDLYCLFHFWASTAKVRYRTRGPVQRPRCVAPEPDGRGSRGVALALTRFQPKLAPVQWPNRCIYSGQGGILCVS